MEARRGPCSSSPAKATDENQTSENWEIILNLCDKVGEEGSEGCVLAVDS
jgi:signal transducing adaptor molecule